MKKTLLISTLLAVAALGIACGPDTPPKSNTNASNTAANANKAADNANKAADNANKAADNTKHEATNKTADNKPATTNKPADK